MPIPHEALDLENRSVGTNGKPTLAEAYKLLKKPWFDGDRDRELGLHLMFLAWVAEAKRLLLEAGKSPGSPQLNSFGPNMLLAKELLAKGEQEAVIEYFDLCAKFWKPQDGRLSDWKTLVISGETPDFGANLAYRLDDWRFENWAKLGV